MRLEREKPVNEALEANADELLYAITITCCSVSCVCARAIRIPIECACPQQSLRHGIPSHASHLMLLTYIHARPTLLWRPSMFLLITTRHGIDAIQGDVRGTVCGIVVQCSARITRGNRSMRGSQSGCMPLFPCL